MIIDKQVTSFKTSCRLKQYGYPQDTSCYVWLNRSKELFKRSDIFIGKDFDKIYTAAALDCELNHYLPDKLDGCNMTITRRKFLYEVSYPDNQQPTTNNQQLSCTSDSEHEAKALMLITLLRKKLIKL